MIKHAFLPWNSSLLLIVSLSCSPTRVVWHTCCHRVHHNLLVSCMKNNFWLLLNESLLCLWPNFARQKSLKASQGLFIWMILACCPINHNIRLPLWSERKAILDWNRLIRCQFPGHYAPLTSAKFGKTKQVKKTLNKTNKNKKNIFNFKKSL